MIKTKNYIGEQFRLNMYFLNHETASDFYLSRWQNNSSTLPLLCVNTLLFLFSISILISAIAVIGAAGPGALSYWFVYLTNWGVMLLTCTTGLAFLVSLIAYLRGNSIDATSGLPWYVKAYWTMYNVMVPVAMLITILYYGLLKPQCLLNNKAMIDCDKHFLINPHVVPLFTIGLTSLSVDVAISMVIRVPNVLYLTATTEDNISAVRRMIEEDKRVTYQQIQASLGIVSDEEITQMIINHGVDMLVHGINSAVMGVLLLASRVPTRLLHLWQPFTFMLLYLTFNIIYYYAGGTNALGAHSIYPSMNWAEPASSSVFVLITAVGFVGLHVFVWVLSLLRDHCARTCGFHSESLPVSNKDERSEP